ncbi:hypothetical protein PO878_04220 [Iamia majanohamensis]|uniref:Uncharacterized protein n=1 Tax=Iamia majanohamensis TaxID=467976 RepID=A0AAF0BWW7_9ACTN|nr:hypothetical protein [Iamia majanohamensis]WCO67929.1 hypothetical protein PO878_04220 [Iamia majanohamensis]
MSRGALVALAAVVVVALVATGVGVFLVTQGDDGGPDDAASDRTTTTSGAPSSSTSAPTSGGSDPVPVPSVPSTDGSDPTSPLPDLPFPGGLGDPLPEGFPTPEGARPGDIGLEVDQSAADVLAFYRSSLPAAGYTVADSEDASTGASLTVIGNGVDGQLVVTDVIAPTRIVWLAG